MLKTVIASCIVLLNLHSATSLKEEDKNSFIPTDNYQIHQIHNFIVLTSPELKDHSEESASAIKEITKQLEHIQRVIPKKILVKIQNKKIWMEWRVKPHGAACCHWSTKWLTDNGYNPDKVGCIEINNAINFVKWSKNCQPCMIIHELAHSYHQMLDKETKKKIRVCYKNALQSQAYEKVKHVDGREKRAYAMNNDKEYLAELTEAYLGKNDFYPFNRDELKKHDPSGYELMTEIWK